MARDRTEIRLESDGPVTVVTLDRPERRNVLSQAMREALAAALGELMESETCRAIVLTGAGGSFCAGGDLSSMEGLSALAGRARLRGLHALVRLLVEGPKPVLAAVEGNAYGAGVSIAAACDHVVAARDASFCCAFNRVGLTADLAALWTLPQRIGLGRTKEMVMFAEPMDATTAERLGLVDRLAEPGQALEVALERARRLAEGAPVAHAMTKALLARFPYSLEDLLHMEADAQGLLLASEDFAEGRTAFFAKRPPRFKGR